MVDFATKPSRKRWLLPLKIVVSTGVLAYLVTRVDFGLMATLGWRVPLMVLAGCLINLAALAVMASRWRALIQAAAGQLLRLRRLYGYYLVGAFYNNLLPGAIGGDFIRIKRLVDRHDMRWAAAARITLVERLMGLAGVVLFVCATLPFAKLPEGWHEYLSANVTHAVMACGIALFVITCVWLCRSLKTQPMSAWQVASTSALVILAQASDMCVMELFLAILGTPLDIVNLIFCVGLSYLAAVLPVSLGGLGVREGVMTAMLGLNGVPVATAALLAVLLLCARLTTAGIGIIVDARDGQ